MKVLIGFLAGAAAGVVLGVLIARNLSTDRAEIGRLREENRRLLEASRAAAAGSGDMPSDVDGPGSREEAVREVTAVGDKAEPASDPARDGAETERLRRELDLYREALGGSEDLLAVLSDRTADRRDRFLALARLLRQCDLPLHLDKLFELLRGEQDPSLRQNMAHKVAFRAMETRDQEIHDRLLGELRAGTDIAPGIVSRMLAEFHGEEGLGKIRELLSDGSDRVRLSAISALGTGMPKSEETVTGLREAQGNPDPKVRGLASIYLAGHDEDFVYEGLFEDWRAMGLSLKADEFPLVEVPPEKIFARLSPADIGRTLKVFGDVAQSHPDENVRSALGKALKEIGARALGGATPAGER